MEVCPCILLRLIFWVLVRANKCGGKCKMSHYISNFWSRLAESSLCELVELVGDKVPLPEIDTGRRDRIFNSWRTFWLFLGQILSTFQSCREALIKARSWIYLSAKKKPFRQYVRVLSGPLKA